MKFFYGVRNLFKKATAGTISNNRFVKGGPVKANKTQFPCEPLFNFREWWLNLRYNKRYGRKVREQDLHETINVKG